MEVANDEYPIGTPIEYFCEYMTEVDFTLRRERSHWFNLTTEGVWVARRHLRPTDVRLTLLKGDEEFTTDVPPTSAELLTLILLGTPYVPEDD